jgi:polysaccharide biosynthesis/export protein
MTIITYIIKKQFCLAFVLGVIIAFHGSIEILFAETNISKDYIVGSGDKLQITVWDHDDLCRIVEISQDGTFTFPLIGKVQVEGKAISIVNKILTDRLSDGYIVAPQITIEVIEYHNKKVFLFGEVIRPGSYILRHNMHLLELISAAGGFTDKRGIECTVVRKTVNKQNAHSAATDDVSENEVITVNLQRMIAGDVGENIMILPNDSVYISKISHVFVTGEVRKPGEIEYAEGMTVRQALSKAGGGTPQAAIARTRIIRVQDGHEIVIKPDLSDRVNPNDILKVPQSLF